MMLKFKAWDKDKKVMSIIDEIDFNSGYILISTGYKSFDEVKVLQYTGLKDMNGVEIYEGDIVKVNVLEGIGPNARIVFKNGMFGVEDDMHGYGYDRGLYSLNLIINRHEVEVKGNIFESSHLLEEIE